MVAEFLRLFRDQLRNDAHLEVVGSVQWLLWAINENIFLARVSMHIDEGHDILVNCFWLTSIFLRFFVRSVDQVARYLLDGTNSGVNPEVRLNVASVEVVTRHARSVITDDDAINVDHWDNLEDDALAQLLGLV